MNPTVFLNHFYLTLDSATYRAIRDSDWLQSVLAPFEQRTTRRNDTTYSGIYYYGRNTYFEFFEEGSEMGKVPGASGVAFGVESAGGAAQFKSVLPDQQILTRKTETGEPAWFHSAAPAGSARADRFRTWLMEYHGDFLKQWYPELAPANANPLRRRNVLDRYVAKIGKSAQRSDYLLKDVTSIELALDFPTRQRLLTMLSAFQYQVSGSGQLTVATGPEVRLLITSASNSQFGIRRVTLSLQRSVEGEIRQRFGRSEIIVTPRGEALWTLQ